MRRAVYRVTGMESGDGEKRASEAVAAVDGAEPVEVDARGGAIAVEYDESRTESGTVAAEIAALGYEVLG